jgi:hypothetical protein
LRFQKQERDWTSACRGYFDFCEMLEKDEYKDACIAECSMQLIKFVGHDVAVLVKRFIDPVADIKQKQYILGFAVPSIVEATVSGDDISGLTASCMELDVSLRSTCISSVVGGLFAHGIPGEEYKKVFELCASPLVEPIERKACYAHSI